VSVGVDGLPPPDSRVCLQVSTMPGELAGFAPPTAVNVLRPSVVHMTSWLCCQGIASPDN
jgi:hypothetical protein